MTIRVLIVDDSAYIRKVISEILSRSPEIEVVGTAWDGSQALEKIDELEPDVITLDLYMRELDGVKFLKEQMKRRPLPVVVCSSAEREDEQVLEAMDAGALEFVQKPTARASEEVYQIEQDLIEKVLGAAAIPPDRIKAVIADGHGDGVEVAPEKIGSDHMSNRQIDAIVLGISTGGPQALRWLLPKLPADLPVPMAIVLHLPVGYTGHFARRLDELSQLEVLEASEGLEMKPGRVILAQAGKHMVLLRSGGSVVVHLSSEPADSLHRPSVDELFHSAAVVYGSRLLGVVMTGMGSDGTTGAAWIKAQGGLVFTESEESCVVYGMPRSVVEAGLSDKIIPLVDFPKSIMESIYEDPDH